MRLAIEALFEPPDHVLIDGLPVSFSTSADGNYRWRLHQLEHRRRKRDREGHPRPDHA